MEGLGGWRDEDGGHEDDDTDYNVGHDDASESDAEVEQQQQQEEDDGELAREAVDTALAWIARVRERERARERAEALADQLAEADADDDDADEHSGPFGRGMQWFHLPHLQGTPAARRGHSATLVPYSVLCGSASTAPLPPLPTTTVTTMTTTRTASLDFMSLIERRICEEKRAKRDRALTAERAARQWKRRRREMVEDEVERVSRQARCGDRVVVFGGNHGRTYMNDLHVLDVEFEGKPVLRWHAIARQADDDHATGKWPAPRAHHTATLVGQTIWIFGGLSSLAFRDEMSDVWALDLCSGEWSCPQLSKPLRPAARHGHTAIAVGEKLVVYGGTNISTLFDDVWEFDTILLCWRRVNARLADAAPGAATTDADAPERPAGRHFHSATHIGLGKMVVHGGRSADEVFRDVLVLDLESELWHVITPTSPPGDDGEIKPRAGHTASLLSSTLVSSPTASYKLQLAARIAVYGGWDGSVDQHLLETGALGDAAVLSVVCEEDMGSCSAAWIKCDAMICGPQPTDRDCHTAVVVETSRSQPRLFVFGGTDGDFQYLGDVHVLDFARRSRVGGVPSLFKLALQYVSDRPEEVWPPTMRPGATPSPPPVDLADACLESVARELLFYASNGGALISL